MPSANHAKIEPLACYWDMVEMECLNIGHKVSEVLIMF